MLLLATVGIQNNKFFLKKLIIIRTWTIMFLKLDPINGQLAGVMVS